MSDIRDKIRKLLSLAEGQANEHESSRAYELASRLMMEHGIERDQLSPNEKVKMKYSEWFDLDQKWQLYAAMAAAELYGVQTLVHRGWEDKKFHFAGRADNVDAAQDTCAFILLQVEALYKAHLPKGMSQRQRADYRRDFKFSCASRVLTRCKDIARGIGGVKNAIVVHRQTLKDEISSFVGATRTMKSRAVAMRSSRAMIDGNRAGDKVDVNRKVAASTTSRSESSQRLAIS